MLEMRISCKFLPETFDQLERFIAPINYSPMNNNPNAIEVKNKRYKIIQEAKRQWLNVTLHAYEIKIQEYEQQFQDELVQLESYLSNNKNNGVYDSTLFSNIKEYITCYTDKLQQSIHQKMSSFRVVLLQHRHRSLKTKKYIGVSPEPYLDCVSNPFNTLQWNQLSLGKVFLL